MYICICIYIWVNPCTRLFAPCGHEGEQGRQQLGNQTGGQRGVGRPSLEQHASQLDGGKQYVAVVLDIL